MRTSSGCFSTSAVGFTPMTPLDGAAPITQFPSRITGLKDDPYRSLAGELRRACFGKATAPPFSEFLWADFLRRRIDRETVKDKFVKALKQALKLAKSHQAHHLPGSRAAQEPD